jgi:hypothetical protein
MPSRAALMLLGERRAAEAISGTGGSAAVDGQEDNAFDTHTPNHIYAGRLISGLVAASPLQHD